MQPSVKTALPRVHWAVTAFPSHLWETPTMATTVTNRPSAHSSHGHWGPSRLPSPVHLPPRHRGCVPLWGSTTRVPSPTRMPRLSLRTQASGHLVCIPTTLVLVAGVAAWEWREAQYQLTCETATWSQWYIFLSADRLFRGISNSQKIWFWGISSDLYKKD